MGTTKLQERYLFKGIPIFDITSANNQRFLICSALGHLYGLKDMTGSRNIYPVLDLEWVPVVSKSRPGQNKKTLQILKSIAETSLEASRFVHACDYDQEGEVIGYSILEYACNGKYEKSLRAKFSTLTDKEIRFAFDNLQKPDKSLAEAGRSRHMLDFIYGVNLSRALSQSFKIGSDYKRYKNLSIGRVQGPTLAFVADREIEIKNFVPNPYWKISAEFEKDKNNALSAQYYIEKIEKQSEAQTIVVECTGMDGRVTEISAKRLSLKPPSPFNTGDLQKEAYRLFKTSPSYTLAIAEKLYLSALVSYPRTSSQKIPASINYRKIISEISKISGGRYSNLTSTLLLKEKLIPNQGPKTDPAHPAIYPTGEIPKRKLDGIEYKIYDLIIKRFLATFGDPATSLHTTISISINQHKFNTEIRSTLYEGWIIFYRPYYKLDDKPIPPLSEGDILKNISVVMQERFTQPPYRFNQASLLDKMEKEQIGTKATRADIISTLYKRNYIIPFSNLQLTVKDKKEKNNNSNNIDSKSGIEPPVKSGIQVTDTGLAVIEAMREYVPDIVSTDLTRSMEEELDNIEKGRKDSVSIIEFATDRLIQSLETFREKEVKIGQSITEASKITDAIQTTLGTCPVCKTGKLHIIKSKSSKKRFVGCSNYFSGICKAAAPLPQNGAIKITGKSCKICSWPVINVVMFYNRKNPWKLCVNVRCPSKDRQDSLTKVKNFR